MWPPWSFCLFFTLTDFIMENESVVSNSHIVVDYSGGAFTNVAGVHDGYVLQKVTFIKCSCVHPQLLHTVLLQCSFWKPHKPVSGGWQAIVKSAIGGDILTECLLKTLESKAISVCLLFQPCLNLIRWPVTSTVFFNSNTDIWMSFQIKPHFSFKRKEVRMGQFEVCKLA